MPVSWRLGVVVTELVVSTSYSTSNWAGLLIFGIVFVSRDCEVGTNASCEESPVSRTRLIYYLFVFYRGSDLL